MYKNKDLISIIIPVYNVQNYISDCLDSIISQSYDNIEVIVVNDGSTDNSPQICEQYADIDSRIKVIHKKNGGLSDARNVGLDNVAGTYLSFVDSDDLVSKDYILDMYVSAIRNNADIVQCQHSRELEKLNTFTETEKELLILGEDIFHRYLRMKEPNVLVCGKLYKMELFDNVRFPFGKIDEDNFTAYIPYYNSNTFVQLNRVLYYYRVNPDSITNRKFSKEKFVILESVDCMRSFLADKTTLFDVDVDYYEYRHDIQLYNQAVCADAIDDYSDEFDIIIKDIRRTRYSIQENDLKYKIMAMLLLHNNRLYRWLVLRRHRKVV